MPGKGILNLADMIKSMTGYGKAETMLESGKLSVEIRSLNGKNADISLKTTLLPKDKELYVRQMTADELKRGSIDIFISFEANAAEGAKKINQELVMEYFRQLNEIAGNIHREFPNTDIVDSSYPWTLLISSRLSCACRTCWI